MSYSRFVPVPLGRWERALCWTIWIAHSLSAFIIAIKASQTKIRGIQFWLSDSSYVANRKMDISDSEWVHFRNTVYHALISYCLHSTVFLMVIRFVAIEKIKLTLFFVGLLLQIYMTSIQCTVIMAVFSFVVTILTVYTRHIAVPWILCLSIVLRGNKMLPYSTEGFHYYLEFNNYLYGAIKMKEHPTENYELFVQGLQECAECASAISTQHPRKCSELEEG
ncbi:hypothetical protein DICVIV_02808 [Dictyocaulus viviparus]|uniref:Uncharacterized protein n=1 Tax=Dictyocaulus viviparus TaxID=29172 RepID=A0A0D8Y4C4_DICVI|nr:hypothetical protein DICVIV_02808 [Dictyocaulus viviparus]